MRASQIRHKEMLEKIPKDAKYVQVVTEKGERKYREIKDLAETDELQLTTAGIPISMKTPPGRPKVVVQPANDAVRDSIKRKRDTMEDDPVLRATRKDPESPDVLRQVLLALSEESACIKFDRIEAERTGQDTGTHSARRINALKSLVDTWLKRKDQLGSKDVDIRAPTIRMLLTYVLDTVREAMTSCGEQEEMIQTVFAKTAQMMGDESWENDLRNRMRNAI